MKHAAALLFVWLVVDCLAARAAAEVFPSLSPAGLALQVAAVAWGQLEDASRVVSRCASLLIRRSTGSRRGRE